jgi:hypothetical protein
MLTNQVEIEKRLIEKQMLDQNPVPHVPAARFDANDARGLLLQTGEH